MTIQAYIDFFSEIKSFLIDRAVEPEGSFLGCTEEEIIQAESKFGKFPAAYKCYLSIMGNSNLNTLFDGDGYSINDIKYGTEVSDIILKQDNYQFNFPYLVLSEHHGYNFTFIKLDKEDPETGYYIETDLNPTIISNKFTSFIRETSLKAIERKPWHEEVLSAYDKPRHPDLPKDGLELKHFLDDLNMQASGLRNNYTRLIEEQDENKGYFTALTKFQAGWIDFMKKQELFSIYSKYNIRVPFSWVDLKYK